jgi:hypothetical protein
MKQIQVQPRHARREDEEQRQEYGDPAIRRARAARRRQEARDAIAVK